MLRIITTLLLFALSLNFAKAQSDPHYSHFMYNQLAINPAYAGSKGALHLMGLYRYQWHGVSGAPRTANLHAHVPFVKLNSGFGLSITNDQIGIANSTFVDGSYAYRMKLSDKRTFSIGLRGRIENTRQDWTQSSAIDLDDEELPLEGTRKTSPNFGIGVYFQDENYYVGLSVPTLLKTTLYDDLAIGGTSLRDIRNYYLIGGLLTRISRDVKFRPSAMLSYTPNSPIDLNLNASFIFMDTFWAGLSYRLGDSVDLVAGFQFNKMIKASLAVDFTTSSFRTKSVGSAELMVEYLFEPECKCMDNIRFF